MQERSSAERIRWAIQGPAGPLGVEAELRPDAVAVRVDRAIAPSLMPWLERTVRGMLGWHLDPTDFEQRLEGTEHARLIDGRRGLSIPQTPSLFAGLLWVICGQQISLAVAFSLRRKLAARYGDPILDPEGELFAGPTAERLVGADLDELRSLGLSQRKAEYLVAAARYVVAARVAEVAGAEGATLEGAEEDLAAELLAIRGLGPWSVNYLLMRSLGFADRVPLGDVALERALQLYFELPERPKRQATEELMRVFAPYRSLATFHLWKSLHKDP